MVCVIWLIFVVFVWLVLRKWCKFHYIWLNTACRLCTYFNDGLNTPSRKKWQTVRPFLFFFFIIQIRICHLFLLGIHICPKKKLIFLYTIDYYLFILGMSHLLFYHFSKAIIRKKNSQFTINSSSVFFFYFWYCVCVSACIFIETTKHFQHIFFFDFSFI